MVNDGGDGRSGDSDSSCELRIGTPERQRALEALEAHMTARRLDPAEYERRSDACDRASNQAELLRIFADLPAPHPQLPLPVVQAANPAEGDSAPPMPPSFWRMPDLGAGSTDCGRLGLRLRRVVGACGAGSGPSGDGVRRTIARPSGSRRAGQRSANANVMHTFSRDPDTPSESHSAAPPGHDPLPPFLASRSDTPTGFYSCSCRRPELGSRSDALICRRPCAGVGHRNRVR